MKSFKYFSLFVIVLCVLGSCNHSKPNKDDILVGEIQSDIKPNIDSILLSYDTLFKDKGLNQNKVFNITVIQYVYHSRLDAVYSGIEQSLSSHNNKYNLNYKVAMGDPTMNATISKNTVKENPDLIITLGTGTSIAVIKETKTIPVVFSVVTDPVATGIADSWEKPGGNKTGISDMDPFEQQIELIKLLKPNVKNVGIIVNYSEPNCEAGMKIVKKALNKYQIPFKEVNATNASEVAIAAKSLAASSDVFFISPANTVYESLGAIQKVADAKNIMVIGGDETAVSEKGALCTYTYNFKQMGTNTAKLAMCLLKYNLNPGDIPVTMPATLYLYFNKTKAEKLSIAIPQMLLDVIEAK
jgi:putative ABC transport system substrate-binding protein